MGLLECVLVMQMWKAPMALLTQHESSHPPPTPPGGWVAAVNAAAAPLEAVMTGEDILGPSDEPMAAATGPHFLLIAGT